MIYPLIKASAPTAVVGIANLVTYLSFSAYSKSQINNRNWRAKQHFNLMKKSIFDEMINDNDVLMRDRHSAIERYFSNLDNKSISKGIGGQSLIDKWNSIFKNGRTAVLQDELQKVSFFQDIRYFCMMNKDSEDKKLLSEMSELCSKKIVRESDFDLPKEE